MWSLLFKDNAWFYKVIDDRLMSCFVYRLLRSERLKKKIVVTQSVCEYVSIDWTRWQDTRRNAANRLFYSVRPSYVVFGFYLIQQLNCWSFHGDPQALDTCHSVISNYQTLISTKDKAIEAGDRSHNKNCINALVNEHVIKSLTSQCFANVWSPNSAIKLRPEANQTIWILLHTALSSYVNGMVLLWKEQNDW